MKKTTMASGISELVDRTRYYKEKQSLHQCLMAIDKSLKNWCSPCALH